MTPEEVLDMTRILKRYIEPNNRLAIEYKDGANDMREAILAELGITYDKINGGESFEESGGIALREIDQFIDRLRAAVEGEKKDGN